MDSFDFWHLMYFVVLTVKRHQGMEHPICFNISLIVVGYCIEMVEGCSIKRRNWFKGEVIHNVGNGSSTTFWRGSWLDFLAKKFV